MLAIFVPVEAAGKLVLELEARTRSASIPPPQRRTRRKTQKRRDASVDVITAELVRRFDEGESGEGR